MYAIALCLCACTLAASTEPLSLSRRPRMRGPGVPTPDNNPHSGDSRRCQVNGISLLEGAMWSPERCSTCRCQRGATDCTSTPCSEIARRMALTWKGSGEMEGDENGRKNDGSGKFTKQVADSGTKDDAERKTGKKLTLPMAREPGGTRDIERTVASKLQNLKKMIVDEDDDDDDNDDDDDDDDSDDDDDEKKTPVHGLPTMQLHSRSNSVELLPVTCVLAESLVACGGVGMTHLPILTDLRLKTLYLADNKISTIPFRGLAGLPNLEWLDLSKNKLGDSSLSPHFFQNVTNLKKLNLDGNSLTRIPLLPPSLEELKINNNKISGLTPHSFKGLSKLLTLELQGNRFHEGNVSPLTFSPLRRTVYLRLDGNLFRELPSSLPPSLQELRLSKNRLENVQEGILSKCPQLHVLDLSHNRIQEDHIAPRAWTHLGMLQALDISYNKLTQVPSFLPTALRQLILHHNKIKHIPGSVFGHLHPGLDSLHLSHNQLCEEGVHAVSFLGLQHSLAELLLDHNQLRTIPPGLPQLKALQLLRLDHNLIRDVTLDSICDTRVSENSSLVSVHLERNLIKGHPIPPSTFSSIETNHSIMLLPQGHEEEAGQP